MSHEVASEQEHDEPSPSGRLDTDDPELYDEAGHHEEDEEPEGAEVLLPRSNWLRIAWVFLAVLWVMAMVVIFVQSCVPR